jgi:general secretion pathway protein M
MERILEQLRKARADVEAWLAKLSQRERVMVSAAAAAVVLFVVWLVSFQVSEATSAREARIDQKTRVLSQVGKLAEGYRRNQAERLALEARLKGAPVQLMSAVAQAGTALGVEVNDLRPAAAPAEVEGVREESVEVNLAGIDLPRLARLLQNLERGAGIVKVRRIRLTTRTDDPALVDATFVVATYQLKS